MEFPSEPSTSGKPSRPTPITEHSLQVQKLQAVVNDADVPDIQIQDEYQTDSDGDSDGEREKERGERERERVRSSKQDMLHQVR